MSRRHLAMRATVDTWRRTPGASPVRPSAQRTPHGTPCPASWEPSPLHEPSVHTVWIGAHLREDVSPVRRSQRRIELLGSSAEALSCRRVQAAAPGRTRPGTSTSASPPRSRGPRRPDGAASPSRSDPAPGSSPVVGSSSTNREGLVNSSTANRHALALAARQLVDASVRVRWSARVPRAPLRSPVRGRFRWCRRPFGVPPRTAVPARRRVGRARRRPEAPSRSRCAQRACPSPRTTPSHWSAVLRRRRPRPRVDLPAPEGPITAVNVPGRAANDTRCSRTVSSSATRVTSRTSRPPVAADRTRCGRSTVRPIGIDPNGSAGYRRRARMVVAFEASSVRFMSYLFSSEEVRQRRTSSSESIRSSRPPKPGSQSPASLTWACRFSMDSRRSPKRPPMETAISRPIEMVPQGEDDERADDRADQPADRLVGAQRGQRPARPSHAAQPLSATPGGDVGGRDGEAQQNRRPATPSRGGTATSRSTPIRKR